MTEMYQSIILKLFDNNGLRKCSPFSFEGEFL
jgi:hypothetical protein